MWLTELSKFAHKPGTTREVEEDVVPRDEEAPWNREGMERGRTAFPLVLLHPCRCFHCWSPESDGNTSLAEQASEAAAIPTQYHFLFLLLLFLVPPLFPHTKSTQTTPLKSTQTTPELQRLKKKQLLPEKRHHHHHQKQHACLGNVQARRRRRRRRMG
jgi:hypothetical protein